jgi:predicted transcriptional regulator
MQDRTLLPLIAGCSTAYLVSFILMKTTIMTEKIKRRGIQMPENYRPDVLELKTVSDVQRSVDHESVLTATRYQTITDLLEKIQRNEFAFADQHVIPVLDGPAATGIIHKERLYAAIDRAKETATLIEEKMFTVYPDNTLDIALEIMLKTKQSLLPVLDRSTKHIVGIITDWDILQVFEKRFIDDKHIKQHISIRNKALRLVKGKRSLKTGKALKSLFSALLWKT